MAYVVRQLFAPLSWVCLATVLLLPAGCRKQVTPPPPSPPKVVVATVVQEDVPIYAEWTGVLDGFVNAEIRAQVPGYLWRQAYREGAKVKKGELLFEIDPRPFQAALDQARANFGKTELDVKRLTPLAAERAVSRQELDDAVQANLANKAAVEAVELNLGFTRITAPIDGIAGVAIAQVGNLVGPATGNLTTVSTVDPIKAYFEVSEQEYLNYPDCFANSLNPPAGGAPENLELILSNGSTYGHKGRLYMTDRQVDVKTGTLRVAALFDNPGDILRPGQFARVRAVVRTEKGALLVPQRAVMELQGSYQVAVVGPDHKVDIRPVKAGAKVDTRWLITAGLHPGEQVVVEGLQKVRQGQLVDDTPPAPQVGANH